MQFRDDSKVYVIDLHRSKSEYYGDFWADFLISGCKAASTGRRYKALCVLVNCLVAYKLWSCNPKFKTLREQSDPFDFLQGIVAKIAKLLGY